MAKRGLAENKRRREKEKERKPNQTARHSLSSLSADIEVRCCSVRDVTTAVCEKNSD